VSRTPTGAEARFTVRNTGKRAGAEVAQVYVGFPAPAGEPPRQLKGFDKLPLGPGQSATVTVPLDERAFSYWDVKSTTWKLAAGAYTLWVGGSSRSLPLHASLQMAGGQTSPAHVLASRIPARPQPAHSLPATGDGGAPFALVALFFVAALGLVRVTRAD